MLRGSSGLFLDRSFQLEVILQDERLVIREPGVPEFRNAARRDREGGHVQTASLMADDHRTVTRFSF
jgi:hypothetical protein